LFAATPAPPYTVVIFTSTPGGDRRGYAALADRMEALAAQQPGYLGIESVGTDEASITLSYWADEASALAWKQVGEHLAAQRLGRERFYSDYRVRVATVHRDYGFEGMGSNEDGVPRVKL